MKISRKSPVTGKTNTMDLPITEEQLAEWQNGRHIQYAMPNLTPDQREFLISGCYEDEFDNLMKEPED